MKNTKIFKFINKFAQLVGSKQDAYAYQQVLQAAGLLGLKAMPKDNESGQLDSESKPFKKYVNPAMDWAGTKEKINITATIDTELSVSLVVSGDSTAPVIQKALVPLAREMSKALKTASASNIIVPPEAPVSWQWVINYG